MLDINSNTYKLTHFADPFSLPIFFSSIFSYTIIYLYMLMDLNPLFKEKQIYYCNGRVGLSTAPAIFSYMQCAHTIQICTLYIYCIFVYVVKNKYLW